MAGAPQLRSEVVSNRQACSGLIRPLGDKEEMPLLGLPPACPQARWAWQGTLNGDTANRTLPCSEWSGAICHSGWSPCWLQRSCLFLHVLPEPTLPAFQMTTALQGRPGVALLVIPHVTRPNIQPKQYGLIFIYKIT